MSLIVLRQRRERRKMIGLVAQRWKKKRRRKESVRIVMILFAQKRRWRKVGLVSIASILSYLFILSQNHLQFSLGRSENYQTLIENSYFQVNTFLEINTFLESQGTEDDNSQRQIKKKKGFSKGALPRKIIFLLIRCLNSHQKITKK